MAASSALTCSNSMVMRNAETGAIVWESDKWEKTFDEELRSQWNKWTTN